MASNQTAFQRRIGRLSMLIDLMALELPDNQQGLVNASRREMELLKEISNRLVELPRSSHDRNAAACDRPVGTSHRPVPHPHPS